MRKFCVCFALEKVYSWINSADSPASCSCNATEPKLMSQFGTVREVVCVRRAGVSQFGAVTVPIFFCSHATDVAGPQGLSDSR
jgi:hypothetical protein